MYDNPSNFKKKYRFTLNFSKYTWFILGIFSLVTLPISLYRVEVFEINFKSLDSVD